MDNFGKTPPAARTNVRRIWHIPMKAVRFDRDYSSKMLTISPSRIRFVFLTAQKLPHMLQVSSFSGLALCSVAARLFRVDGQARTFPPNPDCFLAVAHFVVPICGARGIPFAISAAWAAILAAMIPSFTSASVGQAQMLRRGYIAQECRARMPPQCAPPMAEVMWS